MDADEEHYEGLLKVGFTPEMARHQVRIQQRARELSEANPTLPFITAHIIAGDQVSAEAWHQRVVDGEYEAERATWLVGSYARLRFALDHMPREWVMDNIAELWRGSDPDDTSDEFLALWKDAKKANRNRTITDGKRLPAGNPLTIYRGQMPNEPLGMAWTTDMDIAKKFAKGAGVRSSGMKGYVLEGWVERRRVLGYLTERGESELVCDPIDVFARTLAGFYE